MRVYISHFVKINRKSVLLMKVSMYIRQLA